MADQKIKVSDTGPYLVSGGVPVTTKTPVLSEHGEPLTWKTEAAAETRERVALCRCGASANKPFCDGTHASTEWDATSEAKNSPIGGSSRELEIERFGK